MTTSHSERSTEPTLIGDHFALTLQLPAQFTACSLPLTPMFGERADYCGFHAGVDCKLVTFSSVKHSPPTSGIPYRVGPGLLGRLAKNFPSGADSLQGRRGRNSNLARLLPYLKHFPIVPFVCGRGSIRGNLHLTHLESTVHSRTVLRYAKPD
jgi:hypothetical protein